MFFSVGVLGVVVLAAGLWASTQYGGNYKEVGADGKGDVTWACAHRMTAKAIPQPQLGTSQF